MIKAAADKDVLIAHPHKRLRRGISSSARIAIVLALTLGLRLAHLYSWLAAKLAMP
jgi:hypothetical protein